jgi:hypothetical protein
MSEPMTSRAEASGFYSQAEASMLRAQCTKGTDAMTDTVIAFPTPLGRDEREFSRKGTSSYIRVFEEAAELWDAVKPAVQQSGLAQQIEVFAGAVERLVRHRPEVGGDLVNLNDGCRIELTLMPLVLRAMCQNRRGSANLGRRGICE